MKQTNEKKKGGNEMERSKRKGRVCMNLREGE
jgi:hypothetical protein